MQTNYIKCCDNVQGLRELPDECIDLTITSPPYDNLRTYNGFSWDFDALAAELYRVTKRGGVAVWVVGDATVKGSETGTSFKQALGFMAAGFNLHDTMIYAKHNAPPVGGSTRYFQAFEYMFVFSKGAPRAFNPLTEPRRNACNDKRTQRYKSFTRSKDGSTIRKMVAINQDDPKRRNVWTYLVGEATLPTTSVRMGTPPSSLSNSLLTTLSAGAIQATSCSTRSWAAAPRPSQPLKQGGDTSASRSVRNTVGSPKSAQRG